MSESREDWKLRTFALHYGAGEQTIRELFVGED